MENTMCVFAVSLSNITLDQPPSHRWKIIHFCGVHSYSCSILVCSGRLDKCAIRAFELNEKAIAFTAFTSFLVCESSWFCGFDFGRQQFGEVLDSSIQFWKKGWRRWRTRSTLEVKQVNDGNVNVNVIKCHNICMSRHDKTILREGQDIWF